MRRKDPELMQRISEYIGDYYRENHSTPTTREISSAMGLAPATGYKYLVEMDKQGLLSYQDGVITNLPKISKTKTGYFSAPLVGSIRCGDPETEEEHVEMYVSLPEAIFGKGQFYLLRATGDSMVYADIEEGDLVLIRKQPDCEIGDIVVALDENNENTLKIYGGIDKKSSKVILKYANEKVYPGKVILVNELVIQGVAKHVIKRLDSGEILPVRIPRMAEYERISAKIYGIYLHYVAPEDVHVYSIDECFIDVTGYLHMYLEEAKRTSTNPAHVMAMTMIREVLSTTGITATVGIGTNLYLAKVAMDIVAKKQPADKDGVRIAELNEDSYKFLLWDHQPLTDFWQIGPGKARRLYKYYMYTMGDIAERSQWDEEFFYKEFGIDGEILLDHAWGIEPVTMADIKNYKSEGHSLSNG